MVPRQHRGGLTPPPATSTEAAGAVGAITDEAAIASSVVASAASTALPPAHVPVEAPTASGLRRVVRLVSGSTVMGLPVALLILLVLYPLVAIIIQSVLPNLFAYNPDFTFSLNSLQQVFSDKISYKAVAASTTLGLVTSVGAAVIGTAMAIIARRTNTPGRGAIDTIVWLVFFTPSFLLGEAWTIIMFRGGTLDQYVHLSDGVMKVFFSPVGVAFLLILKNFPFVYLAVSAALIWLGSEFEDAARIAGARGWQAWARINIPLLAPAIISGALIVFAEALSDFGTSATIAQNANVTLITYQIYEAINTFPVNFSQAAALSLLLFTAIGVALVGQNRLTRSRSFKVISGRSRPARMLDLGAWRWATLGFVALVTLLALVAPLAECVLLSFEHAFGNGINPANMTLFNYKAALANGSDDLASLFTSLRLSLLAATIVTAIGLPIAYLVSRTRLPGRRLLSFVTLVTISVPGIILACGYIFAWNSPYLENIGIGGPGQLHVYGTIWLLLAAYVGGNLPYAIRLNIGALDQIGDSLIEAARVQGAGVFQTLARVIAPILQSGLVSIWLLVFTGSMFELAASELLYPPGQPTMPVRITNYFGNFRIEQGMAVAMLNITLVAIFVVGLRSAPWLWRRGQALLAAASAAQSARQSAPTAIPAPVAQALATATEGSAQ